MMETVKTTVFVRGQWEEDIYKQSRHDFQGSETTLYDIIMIDTCIIHFLQPLNVTPRVNPEVNSGLWLIMKYKHRNYLINVKYMVMHNYMHESHVKYTTNTTQKHYP